MSYNLIDKNWIPILDLQGNPQNVGIKELFENAHTYSRISDESPLFECGMYRLCISIVMDAFQTDQEERILEFEDLWNLTAFNKGKAWEILKKHLDDYYQRFDLFDEDRPFYQSKKSDQQDAKERSVSELIPNSPVGNNVMHYKHCKPNDHAFSPEVCAKGLCAMPGFTYVGGRGYKTSINGRPPWYFLIQGENMFQTLLLNCAWGEIQGNIGSSPPFWRMDNPIANKKMVDTSTLACLTWQPRKITLIPSSGGICTYTGNKSDILVKDLLWDQGFSFEGEVWDPHTVLVTLVKQNKSWMFYPEADKHLWREFGPKMLVNKKDFGQESKVIYEKPLIVNQFFEFRDDGTLGSLKDLKIDAFGIANETGQAKPLAWYHEKEVISSDLLEIQDIGEKIKELLDVVSYIESMLITAIKVFYPREGKGAKNPLLTLREHAISAFSHKIEHEFRFSCLQDLARLGKSGKISSFDGFLKDWKLKVMRIGYDILKESIGGLDTDADFLERQVNSFNLFRNAIYKKYQLYGGE